jgi:hypothetical protein
MLGRCVKGPLGKEAKLACAQAGTRPVPGALCALFPDDGMEPQKRNLGVSITVQGRVGRKWREPRNVTSHLDMHRIARELIEQHGDEALLLARMRAEAMSAHRDVESASMWLGVMRAIKALASKTSKNKVE